MACASLVSPPLFGILNTVQPYVHLNSSYNLEESVYIAGVINPMFKTSKKFQEFYDVIIPIDKPNENVNKSKSNAKK